MEKTENRFPDFQELDTEKKILIRSSVYKVPEGKSAEEALKLFREKLAAVETDTVSIKRRPRILFVAVSIAAGLLLFIGIRLFLLGSGGQRISAGKGQVMEYFLSDGSKVVLNAGSYIKFSKRDFTENRNVFLCGEAYFEVVKGTPFTISTNTGMIRVYGTSFNVFSRNGSFKVSCLTGSVEVSAAEKSIMLLPGESARITGNALEKFTEKDTGRIKSWIDGEFFYENTCLIDVFEEMERQFDVKITSDNFESKYFTGSFSNKDLRTALEIVCIPMDLKYEVGKNNKIFIKQTVK